MPRLEVALAKARESALRSPSSLGTAPVINAEEPQFPLHEGQMALWESAARIVVAAAGTQGGKTVCAPSLTLREIQRTFNPDESNEHLVASPTFRLQANKLLPEYIRVLCDELKVARFVGSPAPVIIFTAEGVRKLTGSPRGKIVIRFGHAQNPESLESATYKSALLDEAGQVQFKEGSYDAILRRLSVYSGRCFILTTPYAWNWLKSRVVDKAGIEDIAHINWESRLNPRFPEEEWERARRDLPTWKFDMFYRGLFTRPAGQIYDCFLAEDASKGGNLCKRFKIPKSWPLFAGVDFGNINTAALVLAQEMTEVYPGEFEPTGRYFVVREYHAAEARNAPEHIKIAFAGITRQITAYGGALGENGWRESWALAGMPVYCPPITGTNSVDVQIQRVWTAFNRRNLIVFDDLSGLITEIQEYAREIDDEGNVSEKIDNDAKYHLLAALRYICTPLFKKKEDDSD